MENMEKAYMHIWHANDERIKELERGIMELCDNSYAIKTLLDEHYRAGLRAGVAMSEAGFDTYDEIEEAWEAEH